MSVFVEIAELLYTARIVPILGYVGLSLLAFFVLSHNVKGTSNRIFALMALSAAFWNVAMYLVLGAGDPDAASFAWRVYNSVVLVLVPSWTYFAMNLRGTGIAPSLLYAPSAVFLPLVAFTDLVHSGAGAAGNFYVSQPGPLFTLYNLYILGYILYGILTLSRVYGIVPPSDRVRIKWVLVGIGIVVLTASYDITLRLSGINALPLSPATSIFAVLGIGYSFIAGRRNR